MQADYVYTHTGWQRPVFLNPDVTQCFDVALMEGDRARVEISHDPVDVVKAGKAQWEPYDGGLGGGLYGASALRVCVERLSGWVKVTVKPAPSVCGSNEVKG